MNNSVGWFEIYVDDIGRAKAFYEGVFKVEVQKMNNPDPDNFSEMEMWSFPMDQNGYGAPGALIKMPGFEAGGNGVIVYFTCEDCAVEEARVTQNGGRIHRSKTSIGDYGFIALAVDTEGNMIGLHSLK